MLNFDNYETYFRPFEMRSIIVMTSFSICCLPLASLRGKESCYKSKKKILGFYLTIMLTIF